LISDNGTIRNSGVCYFKESRKAAVTKYYPGDLKSYQFSDDKRYVSKNVLVKGVFRQCFIEVILEGKVNLYHHYKGKEYRYYIKKDSGEMIGLNNTKYLVGLPDSGSFIPSRHEYGFEHSVYKNTLLTLYSDCPEVAEQVYTSEYNVKSLATITRAYINRTCTGERCIDYERDLRKIKDRVGIWSGVQLSTINYSGASVLTRPDVTDS